MDFLTDTVSLMLQNQTRADLYALWLDEYEVRPALTKRQVDETFDGRVGVAVVDERFGDDDVPELLEALRARNPICEYVAIQERSELFPHLSISNRLIRPVFEDDLVEMVATLMRRVNYRVAIQEYYRTNVNVASLEIGEGEEEISRERYEELEARADHLRSLLAEYRSAMDSEDIEAIMRSLTVEGDVEVEGSTEAVDKKHRPSKCSNCGREWGVTRRTDPTQGFERLGAYVWRCTDCGHVQMHADPSHQRLSSYRR